MLLDQLNEAIKEAEETNIAIEDSGLRFTMRPFFMRLDDPTRRRLLDRAKKEGRSAASMARILIRYGMTILRPRETRAEKLNQ